MLIQDTLFFFGFVTGLISDSDTAQFVTPVTEVRQLYFMILLKGNCLSFNVYMLGEELHWGDELFWLTCTAQLP